MEFRDYYATLGVAKTATSKEIKQAFRKLARQHHPDVNPGDKGAESKFKQINEAYEVLGDAEKRRKYDELGANWRQYEQTGAPGGPGFPPQGGGFRTMTEEEMREMFGDSDPFSDFFHAFFSGAGRGQARGGGRGRARAPRKGRDLEQEIQLGLEDAYIGATRRLAIKQDGHARTVDVRIPAGVRDGSRVRIAGEGEHGAAGTDAGDSSGAPREVRTPGQRLALGGRSAVDHGRTWRRGGRADAWRKDTALEDSGDDAERAGLSIEGPRHARGRQDDRTRRSLRHGRRAAAASADR
jgi:DnaJ-class molecular chaperone